MKRFHSWRALSDRVDAGEPTCAYSLELRKQLPPRASSQGGSSTKHPLSGASDHGVSEAIYLNDPDGNGLELYWDRPRDYWPLDAEGKLTLYAHPLDVRGLLALAA